jgi:acetyl esterase/lipase
MEAVMKRDAMRLRIIAIGLLCAVVGVAHGTHKPATLADYMRLSGPNPSERLSYGSSPYQFVELFQPRGPGPFPVVLLIHGGCFKNEYQGMPQMRGIAAALSSQGIAVWSIEYRGLDEPGGGYPGTFQDVNAALDMLAAQAESRHFDIDRIIAVGHSAGAYLALWIAGRALVPASSPLHDTQSIPVRNVVAMGGLGDLRSYAEHLQEACGYSISQVTGVPSAGRQDVYADTTPIELSPNGSHTVFINGELDNFASPRDARDYADRVRRRGDTAETVVLPGASHFDEVSLTSPSWRVVLGVIRRAVGLEKK